jgi:molybdopterin synthase sulfur carrier subunit
VSTDKTIDVLYFASIRETIGLSQESVCTHVQTVGELRTELAQRGGEYARALASELVVRCALNQSMCTVDQLLVDGAEVAFFPPVTGG